MRGSRTERQARRIRQPTSVAALLILLLLATPGPAAGQIRVEQDRPVERERELELPGPEEEPVAPILPILPPVPPPIPGTAERLPGAAQFEAKGFRFEGNTVFSDEELAEVAAPYLGRWLSSEDLQQLRNALTIHYVNNRYVNSGAVLPDQEITDGIVEYRIIEGRLTDIEVTGNQRFRDRYLRSRLDLGEDEPLNIDRLEQKLQLLLQDDRIRRLDAQLGPGAGPGQGRLLVEFEEASPWRAFLEANNHQSPSIGAERGRIYFAHRNLTGWGDVLSGSYSATDGLDDVEFTYALPLTANDTMLNLRYTHSDSIVVENPFDSIDIESVSLTYAVGITHPVYRSRNTEFVVGLTGELRESRTYLLGRRFSFSPGAENGKTRASILRFSQDWVRRDQRQVLAARSTISWGLDAFGATVQKNSTEDGQFLAWLGQFQWARRFDSLWGLEAIFRTDIQLTTDPVLPLEQFSVGGATSVRGYRENQLVRDMGFVSSLELRAPVWKAADGRPILQLAPFIDMGRAWNTNRKTFRPKTLTGAGVGLRFSPFRRLHAEIYWAEELREVEDSQDRDLQDSGIHFRIQLDLM